MTIESTARHAKGAVPNLHVVNAGEEIFQEAVSKYRQPGKTGTFCKRGEIGKRPSSAQEIQAFELVESKFQSTRKSRMQVRFLPLTQPIQCRSAEIDYNDNGNSDA